jgi:hypothetical protein
MTWRLEEHAKAVLFGLRDDPTQAKLFRQLKALLVVIVTEPGSKAARQRGYQGGLWRVDVPGQDWMILWELIDDEVVVGYIGPGL